MIVEVRLAIGPIAADAELAAFLGESGNAGAIVSFCGLARGTSKDGSTVSRLHLDHHPRLTEPSMRAIAEEGAKRFKLSAVRVVHRHGAIGPGETIVFVAAAAPHRRAAFEGADYVMDRLKSDAIFWKREQGPDGVRWIEPTEDDRADLARWGE